MDIENKIEQELVFKIEVKNKEGKSNSKAKKSYKISVGKFKEN